MGAKKYKIALSNKDETVNSDYIGIYELFTDEKYTLPGYSAEEWCLSQKRLKEMRLKTFNNVKMRFEKSGIRSYSTFWNGNLDSINSLGLNEFDKLQSFKDLSTIMISFEKVVPNKYVEGKRVIVSFGINRETYKKYFIAKKKALNSQEKMPDVKLTDRKKRHRKDLYQGRQIKAEIGGIEVKVSDNALMEQFEEWRALKGMKRTEAIYLAVDTLLKTYPLSEIKDRNAYVKKTDVNNSQSYEILVSNRPTELEEYVNINVKIPLKIHLKARDIINRYNDDIDNITKPKLIMASYVSQAMNHFNNSVPLKYSDPKSYKEYMEIKEVKEYNDSVSGSKR